MRHGRVLAPRLATGLVAGRLCVAERRSPEPPTGALGAEPAGQARGGAAAPAVVGAARVLPLLPGCCGDAVSVFQACP